jgi:hypothetical protein
MWEHENHAADHWHSRAAQARAMAANLTSEESRRLMLQVAEAYDQLAAKAERERKP